MRGGAIRAGAGIILARFGKRRFQIGIARRGGCIKWRCHQRSSSSLSGHWFLRGE
jgi:hypothetical protein